MINTAPVAVLGGAVPGSMIRSGLPGACWAAGQEQPSDGPRLSGGFWPSAAGLRAGVGSAAPQDWEIGVAGAMRQGRNPSSPSCSSSWALRWHRSRLLSRAGWDGACPPWQNSPELSDEWSKLSGRRALPACSISAPGAASSSHREHSLSLYCCWPSAGCRREVCSPLPKPKEGLGSEQLPQLTPSCVPGAAVVVAASC